jgi:CRP-like cAMP-binding protein
MQALQAIYQHTLLSGAELNTIFDAHKLISFNKGDFLLKKGKVASSYFCISKGLVRSYVYDFTGNDITTGFIGNDEIAIDVVSLFHQVPTVEYFQALPDGRCHVIDFDKFQELYHSIKGFNEWDVPGCLVVYSI